jgi:hypothetical protein
LAQAYRTCQKNDFGAFVLDRLLVQMAGESWRLVILLDEFDALLHHPILNSAEFFGSLRSLASRSRGALALVLASRCPLKRLNEDTQMLSRTGSPYFNFLTEIVLGVLPGKYVGELLRQAGDRFTRQDRRFVQDVAGGQPYLLQAAASALWDAYVDGEKDSTQRQAWAGEHFYDQVVPILNDIWRCWSPAKQKAITAIGLGQISSVALGERDFRLDRLTQVLPDLGPELRELTKQGFIAEDSALPEHWRVRPGVLLWWLADEIVRLARDDTPFERWLLAEEWQGQLTRGEKDQLRKAGRRLGGWLEKGVTTLIEAAAKGAAAG